jgi:sigma-B regulation protein RsbQ
LVSPSPCYINDGDYIGGFTRQDIGGMIDALDSNYLGWASAIAPVIMGRPDRPDLIEVLEQSFCRAHPDRARAFAKVTFLSDHRADVAEVHTRALILQVTDDVIAPVSVGQFMQRSMPGSELVLLKTRGHCPHMSEPAQTIAAIRGFLAPHGDHG